MKGGGGILHTHSHILCEQEVKKESGVDRPELYLSCTSFTKVTLAERLKIPSISKPDAHTQKKECLE